MGRVCQRGRHPRRRRRGGRRHGRQRRGRRAHRGVHEAVPTRGAGRRRLMPGPAGRCIHAERLRREQRRLRRHPQRVHEPHGRNIRRAGRHGRAAQRALRRDRGRARCRRLRPQPQWQRGHTRQRLRCACCRCDAAGAPVGSSAAEGRAPGNVRRAGAPAQVPRRPRPEEGAPERQSALRTAAQAAAPPLADGGAVRPRTAAAGLRGSPGCRAGEGAE